MMITSITSGMSDSIRQVSKFSRLRASGEAAVSWTTEKKNMGIDVNISMSTSKDGDWTNKVGDLTGKVRMINGDLTNKKQETWWLNQQSWGVKQQATFGFAEHWGIQYLFSFHVGKMILIHWTLTNNGEWNNRHGFSHQSHGFSQ